jgi:toxin CcdB
VEQFDVYRIKRGETVVLLQHGHLNDLQTRIVAPIIPKGKGKLSTSLNPILRFSRRDWILATQLINVVKTSDIRDQLGSVADQDYAIKRAIEQLFLGI